MLQQRLDLNHIKKDPTVIHTIRYPVDEEYLLAFDLQWQLIEQCDHIPSSVQDTLVRTRGYQFLQYVKNPADSAVQYVASINHEFAASLASLTDEQRKLIGAD